MGQKWRKKLNNSIIITYQQRNNHSELSATNCGLLVSNNNNWLGASPDGIVHDPSDIDQPSGLLEIKKTLFLPGTKIW